MPLDKTTINGWKRKYAWQNKLYIVEQYKHKGFNELYYAVSVMPNNSYVGFKHFQSAKRFAIYMLKKGWAGV